MGRILLKPGDIFLYRPASAFGKLIALKTWHSISHVELYDGRLKSWASRDGIGVNLYGLRLSQLKYVLRPLVPLDLEKGRAFGRSMLGTPYGWLDLLQFAAINVNARGIVCSPFVAAWLRAAGWDVFPTDPVERVAPFQFLDLVEPGSCEIAYGPDVLEGIPPVDSKIRTTVG